MSEPVSVTRLKSLSERINRLMDERDAIGSDIRDIYAEAKSNGFIPKALRKAIARLRMDPDKRQEEDLLLDTYEHALGAVGKAMRAVREGATLDDAAEANGIHRATLARARAVAKQSENATPRETPDLGKQSPAGSGEQDGDHTLVAQPATTANLSSGLCPVPPGSVAPTSDGNGFRMKGEAEPLAETSREHSLASCDGALAKDRPTTQREDRASPGPLDLTIPSTEPPDLTIPQFLRRARASA